MAAKLAEASQRIRRLRAFSGAVRFALLAHLVLAPWLLLKALLPLPVWLYLLAFFLIAGSGAAYGHLRPLPLPLVARLLDERLALKERLDSALEVMPRHGHPIIDALLHDAAIAAAGVRVATVFPLAHPPEAPYLLLAMAFAGALYLIPPLPFRVQGPVGLHGVQATDQEQQPVGQVAEAVRPDSRTGQSSKELGEGVGRESSRGQLAPRQPWGEPNAPFKDTALASKHPDFLSFLKRGDERLRLLTPSLPLPDLQGDYTQSPSQAQARRMQETLREARLGKLSPAELEQLLGELKSLYRSPEQQGSSDEKRVLEDSGGAEGGPSDRRLEALERALSRLREKGAAREGGRGLKSGPELAPGAVEQGGEQDDWPEGSRGEGEERGSRPGRAPSPQVRGRPTPRVDARTLDSVLSGQVREGEQESYDTGLSGPGAKTASGVPYLDLLAKYRQIAEEALSKERVPFNYREQVKEYFKSLER